MVRLTLWFVSLVIILFLAVHPALQFRFEASLGRRSVYLRGLTHQGVCMVMLARKELPCV